MDFRKNNKLSDKDKKTTADKKKKKRGHQPGSSQHPQEIMTTSLLDLDKKWENLYRFRNKVAHNKDITKSDYKEIIEVTTKIKRSLIDAFDKMDQIEIPDNEREDVIMSVDKAVIESEALSALNSYAITDFVGTFNAALKNMVPKSTFADFAGGFSSAMNNMVPKSPIADLNKVTSIWKKPAIGFERIVPKHNSIAPADKKSRNDSNLSNEEDKDSTNENPKRQ